MKKAIAAICILILLFVGVLQLNRLLFADLSIMVPALCLDGGGTVYMTANTPWFTGVFAIDTHGSITGLYLERATQKGERVNLLPAAFADDTIYLVREYRSGTNDSLNRQQIIALEPPINTKSQGEILYTCKEKSQAPYLSISLAGEYLMAARLGPSLDRMFIDVAALGEGGQSAAGQVEKVSPLHDAFVQAAYQGSQLYALTASGSLLRYQDQAMEVMDNGLISLIRPGENSGGSPVLYYYFPQQQAFYHLPAGQRTPVVSTLFTETQSNNGALVDFAVAKEGAAGLWEGSDGGRSLVLALEGKEAVIEKLSLSLGAQALLAGTEMAALTVALALLVFPVFLLMRLARRKRQLYINLMLYMCGLLVFSMGILILFQAQATAGKLQDDWSLLGHQVGSAALGQVDGELMAGFRSQGDVVDADFARLRQVLSSRTGDGDMPAAVHRLIYSQGGTNRILLAENCSSGLAVEEVYPAALSALISQAIENGRGQSALLQMGGRRQIVSVSPVTNRNNSTVGALVTLISDSGMQGQVRAEGLRLLLSGLVATLLLLALWGLVLRRRLAPVRAFRQAFLKLAAGDYNTELQVKGHDEFRELSQVFNNMREEIAANSYRYNAISRSYYRFVPRNIYEILDRDSILSVNFGDSKRISSTIAITALVNRDQVRRELEDSAFMDFVNSYFSLINHKIENNHGILISNDFNMSAMNSLYAKGSDDGIDFAVSLLENMHTERVSRSRVKAEGMVIIHTTQMLYGIAGTEERAFPFLLSAEVDFLTQLSQSLRRTNIGLVVTEEALQGAKKTRLTRYIGYVESRDLKRSYKLYEILDHYKPDVRAAKEEVIPTFDRALELFYHKDFYLARNLFSAVLRTCPDDGIARWYLFACDKYFNTSDPASIRNDLLGLDDSIYQ